MLPTCTCRSDTAEVAAVLLPRLVSVLVSVSQTHLRAWWVQQLSCCSRWGSSLLCACWSIRLAAMLWPHCCRLWTGQQGVVEGSSSNGEGLRALWCCCWYRDAADGGVDGRDMDRRKPRLMI